MTVREHEREEIVREARIDFLETYSAWLRRHELTNIEVAQILVSPIETSLKYALRFERHGDGETPAGLAE